MSLFRASVLLTRAAVVAAPLTLLALTAVSTPAAHAQAIVSFTGGNGVPVVFSLDRPVTYTLTAFPFQPLFILDGVGNFLNGQATYPTTLSYTINSGPTVTLDRFGTGQAFGAVTPDDVFIYSGTGTGSPFAAGDIITLNPGTITLNNYLGPTPAGGSYNTFIINFFTGQQVSTNGVTAPEPATIALLLTAGVPVVGRVRRRAKHRA